MRNFLRIFLICLVLFASPASVHANSDYVLPYPSFMPGSKFYTVHLLWENIMKYWHFGSFSQFKYNLSLSDKYLVEAKTLFEYKQYYLGYSALQKSDKYFTDTLISLNKAKKENKNIVQKNNMLKSAARKHIEVLEDMKKIVPEEFVWQEEKKDPITLSLSQSVDKSVRIRKSVRPYTFQ